MISNEMLCMDPVSQVMFHFKGVIWTIDISCIWHSVVLMHITILFRAPGNVLLYVYSHSLTEKKVFCFLHYRFFKYYRVFRSLSHRNYTFCSNKILLVPSRHSRSLGFQPCKPIFHIHLCTVGHQNFQDQKFEIGLLATQKQIKTY